MAKKISGARFPFISRQNRGSTLSVLARAGCPHRRANERRMVSMAGLDSSDVFAASPPLFLLSFVCPPLLLSLALKVSIVCYGVFLGRTECQIPVMH